MESAASLPFTACIIVMSNIDTAVAVCEHLLGGIGDQEGVATDVH